MSTSDDYYYRRKPHASIVQYQHLSVAERGALITYEDRMYTRPDGTIPDERTAKGMAWHVTALGVRNRRTVDGLVAGLLEKGALVRLADGKLTSEEVQRELGDRRRQKVRRSDGGGGGEQSSGGQSGGAGSPLTVIPGGRRFPQRPVEHHRDEMWTPDESVGNRDLESRFPTKPAEIYQSNQWPASLCSVAIESEVVAAITGVAARARGHPLSVRA